MRFGARATEAVSAVEFVTKMEHGTSTLAAKAGLGQVASQRGSSSWTSLPPVCRSLSLTNR